MFYIIGVNAYAKKKVRNVNKQSGFRCYSEFAIVTFKILLCTQKAVKLPPLQLSVRLMDLIQFSAPSFNEND